jgi:aubergine-like protein
MAIKKAEEEGGKTIKVMLVLVNKRVSQRFFNNQNPSRMCNPTPGTFVNTGVVEADTYDFFLVSQTSRQGVVSPTHYTVLYDTIQEEEEKIQLLTFKLCFTYYNVSGSIKVPAPIQYAHRLANLIGDRSKGRARDSIPIPHDYFGQKLRSLYFI